MREGGKKWQKHPKSTMGRPSTTPAQHRAPYAMRVKELGSPLISRWEADDPHTRLTEMGHNSEQWAAPTNRTHVTCHETHLLEKMGLATGGHFCSSHPALLGKCVRRTLYAPGIGFHFSETLYKVQETLL